ncbi:MAG TPA: SRPBCC family protein [Candidatus Limnocylindrales bacterium]|nr:SRPBCC family protein [Candidatus Limnocylindrales bacterium]
MESQTHTEVVRAPIELCFATLVDFAEYPSWFRVIRKATIENADDAAGRWTVRFELDAILKTITYTLDYDSERPSRLTWKMKEGDLKAIDGEYQLVELEPGLTEATCTQSIDVGLWVPGLVRRAFEQTAIVDSVREFKQAAEARAGV